MKGFILSSEDETIAVILLTDKDTFYKNVRTAIAEHFVCGNPDDVSLDISDDNYRDHKLSQSFDAISIEDGEDNVRRYNLRSTYIY